MLHFYSLFISRIERWISLKNNLQQKVIKHLKKYFAEISFLKKWNTFKVKNKISRTSTQSWCVYFFPLMDKSSITDLSNFEHFYERFIGRNCKRKYIVILIVPFIIFHKDKSKFLSIAIYMTCGNIKFNLRAYVKRWSII